jgi:hypothetical protein
MEQSRQRVRATLDAVKAFLNQEQSPRLSEADTKANCIEPVILALGWSGIGVVTREYYVKNSQEFIDYVMTGSSGPLLAIEAKALSSDLTEKNAAQLIQYCSVEGIEWAALTNGRELQFFNTFLRPDLAAKRILSLDLLAYNSDAEFDALFDQVWQLSRESMTTPTGVRTWLNQRRLDTALRHILLNPSSAIIKQLRRTLASSDIQASPQDLAQWFRSHLTTPITAIPARAASETAAPASTATPPPNAGSGVDRPCVNLLERGNAASGTSLGERLKRDVELRWPQTGWRTTTSYVAAESDGETFMAFRARKNWLFIELTLPNSSSHPRLAKNRGNFRWSSMTRVLRVKSESEIDSELISLIGQARDFAGGARRRNVHHGVKLSDLLAAGYLRPGASLILTAGPRDVAHATLTSNGMIEWEGNTYRSLSDRAFARLIGPTRTSLNGWWHWFAQLPHGRERLCDIRDRYKRDRSMLQQQRGA